MMRYFEIPITLANQSTSAQNIKVGSRCTGLMFRMCSAQYKCLFDLSEHPSTTFKKLKDKCSIANGLSKGLFRKQYYGHKKHDMIPFTKNVRDMQSKRKRYEQAGGIVPDFYAAVTLINSVPDTVETKIFLNQIIHKERSLEQIEASLSLLNSTCKANVSEILIVASINDKKFKRKRNDNRLSKPRKPRKNSNASIAARKDDCSLPNRKEAKFTRKGKKEASSPSKDLMAMVAQQKNFNTPPRSLDWCERKTHKLMNDALSKLEPINRDSFDSDNDDIHFKRKLTKCYLTSSLYLNFFVDSGAKSHMCYDRSVLQNYEEVDDLFVYIVNDSKLDVKGKVT